MFFGQVPIDQAIGAILAHSYQSQTGRIRKGQVLSPVHVATMRAEGVTHLSVARLSDDDHHEDAAASLLADALAGEHLRIGAAATGRVNLHARVDGMTVFRADDIHRVNAIDESITVATLMPDARVVAGQIVATIKIIPYGVDRRTLSRALDAIQHSIDVCPMQPSTACLIQTRLPILKDTTLDKTCRTTENRLLERHSRLLSESRPAHTVDAVVAALADAQAESPDWILIFGASAISDRQDTIPAAIEAAGGVVEHFGMPMDPGNLLLLGRLGRCVVIGMPGCARSPRHNGLDMVLDRLACGVPVSRHWLSSLGVGGLLKEVVDRPRPRMVTQDKPTISALLLAAGSSSRFGEQNKLLIDWHGRPLIQHCLLSIANSRVADITVVTGHEHTLIEQAIRRVDCEKPLQLIHNDAYATGMASSVVRGFSALIDSDAIVVCLGDMPNVSSDIIDVLVQTFRSNPDKAIYIPVHAGRRGNPVLIARRLFDSVLGLQGDTGARALAEQFADSVQEVSTDMPGVRQDIDTGDDVDALAEV